MRDEGKEFDVRAVAAALAFVMPGWTLEAVDEHDSDRSYRATLAKGDAKLFLRRAYGERRLRVSGSYPNGYHPYGNNDEITVDPSRDAATIARDIERRILPTYLPKLAEILTNRAGNEKRKAEARALVKELAKAFRCNDPTVGERAPQPDLARPTEAWTLYPGDPIYRIEVDSYNPERITFKEVRVTRDQALQLAAMFRPPTTTPKGKADGVNATRGAARRTTRRTRA